MRLLSYWITGRITDRITDQDYGSTYRPTYGDKSDPGAAKAGIDQFLKEKLYENGIYRLCRSDPNPNSKYLREFFGHKGAHHKNKSERFLHQQHGNFLSPGHANMPCNTDQS